MTCRLFSCIEMHKNCKSLHKLIENLIIAEPNFHSVLQAPAPYCVPPSDLASRCRRLSTAANLYFVLLSWISVPVEHIFFLPDLHGVACSYGATCFVVAWYKYQFTTVLILDLFSFICISTYSVKSLVLKHLWDFKYQFWFYIFITVTYLIDASFGFTDSLSETKLCVWTSGSS